MKRLMEYTVLSGLVIIWFLAGWPTRRSSLSVKATMEGVVRWPSEFWMTTGWPPSMMATQELVVPRSIPMILPTGDFLGGRGVGRRHHDLHPRGSQHALVQVVSLLVILHHSGLACRRPFHAQHRLVPVRIEPFPHRREALQPPPALEDLDELLLDHADALEERPEILRFLRGADCPFEIIDEADQVPEEGCVRIPVGIFALPQHALAEVLEIRLLAKQAVLVVRDFLLQGGDPVLRARARSVRGRSVLRPRCPCAGSGPEEFCGPSDT